MVEEERIMHRLAFHICQTIRESLLILDNDLRVNMANDAFLRTFKTSREVVEKCLLPEMENGDWNIPALLTALQSVMESGAPLENFVVKHHFLGIGQRTMSLSAQRIERDEGEALLLLLAIEDITEHERIAELSRLHLQKLEQSNRELQDFAYIASHDLQEPLRAIQAFSERLRLKSAPVLSEQGVDYLDRIEKAATRMRQLISDLLAYSRVTTKTNPVELVDLGQIVQTVLSDLSVRLKETQGRVTAGELPFVHADASQLRQLLQNLIDNSLKFHRAGVAPNVKISSLGVQGGFYSLQVEDNGIGFEEKYAERIFSPFERLHSQRFYPGTGIGLAICRKIVERHGGQITAQSELGKGTVFHLLWPVDSSEPADGAKHE